MKKTHKCAKCGMDLFFVEIHIDKPFMNLKCLGCDDDKELIVFKHI